MIDEVEETDRPRSLSYFFGDGLTVLQAFAPDFSSIYGGYFLCVGRDVGVEGQDLSVMQRDRPRRRRGLGGEDRLRHGVQY